MKVLLIRLIMIAFLACSQDVTITESSSDTECPLVQGKRYYVDVAGRVSMKLGVYQIVDGEVTFTDAVTGEVCIIKETIK